ALPDGGGGADPAHHRGVRPRDLPPAPGGLIRSPIRPRAGAPSVLPPSVLVVPGRRVTRRPVTVAAHAAATATGGPPDRAPHGSADDGASAPGPGGAPDTGRAPGPPASRGTWLSPGLLVMVGAVQAATGFFRGRPRGRLRGTTVPCRTSCPPQTPHGSERSRAPARHSCRIGQSAHRALASSTSSGSSANHRSAGCCRHGRSVPRSSVGRRCWSRAAMRPVWLDTWVPSSLVGCDLLLLGGTCGTHHFSSVM